MLIAAAFCELERVQFAHSQRLAAMTGERKLPTASETAKC